MIYEPSLLLSSPTLLCRVIDTRFPPTCWFVKLIPHIFPSPLNRSQDVIPVPTDGTIGDCAIIFTTKPIAHKRRCRHDGSVPAPSTGGHGLWWQGDNRLCWQQHQQPFVNVATATAAAATPSPWSPLTPAPSWGWAQRGTQHGADLDLRAPVWPWGQVC